MGRENWKKMRYQGGCGVYGLGLIGAVIYFLQQATTVWEGLIGLLKSLVWPALLIHKLLGFLNI